jgi:hypothetical protein
LGIGDWANPQSPIPNPHEKNLKKSRDESSASKNTSILDFLGNSKESQALSRQKRKRSDNERENNDSDREERKNYISRASSRQMKQVVNLLDDSPSEEINSKNKNDNNSSSPAKKKKSNKDSQFDLQNESSISETKKEKVKKNRENCSICRTGGDLLLCDNCPKSFHMECLKMKPTEIPEGEWYCPGCQ